MKARVSSFTFLASVSGRSSPEPLMGEAAPMLVAGAMTAKLAATVMKVPAEAACAPEGETKTATGERDSRMVSTMSRVESRRPPGVSSSTMMSTASSSWALPMARAR